MSIMKVTKIQRQKKETRRFSVYINGNFSFGINETDLYAYGLSENMELSNDLYNTIIDELVVKRAKFLALRYLSYKDRTEKETRDKLRSYEEFSESVMDGVIDELKAAGFINDEKYAELFMRSKAGNRLDGSYKIKRQLAEKGVKTDMTNQDLGINEIDNAVTLIEKRLRSIDEPDYSDKKRIFNYLVRKGYSYSSIYAAFKRVNEEFEYEWD